MFSLIVRSYSGPEALAVSLRAAFPGVVSGLIADALVVAPPGDADSAAMADAAGATLVVEPSFVEGFQAACHRSRQSVVLLMDSGIYLEEGALEAFRPRAPLPEGRVIASAPIQLGLRGRMQRLLGRVTRDQVLALGRGHAMALREDPWAARFGRGLKTLPFRAERPGRAV